MSVVNREELEKLPKLVAKKPSFSRELKPRYAMNDLGSVYTHYDPATGKNVATENLLKGGK